MYIVYTMIIYHVLIKVFSFSSGVMLSSSFSDALLLENVFVIRFNIRARLVSLLGPTSQKQRLVGCFVSELNGPSRQYFTLYQAVFQREGKRKEKRKRREKCPNNRPPRTYCMRSRPLPYSNMFVGRPGTGNLLCTIAHPTTPRSRWITVDFRCMSCSAGPASPFFGRIEEESKNANSIKHSKTFHTSISTVCICVHICTFSDLKKQQLSATFFFST